MRTVMLTVLAIAFGVNHGRAADPQAGITDTVLTCVRGIATGNVDLIASTFAEDATAFFPLKSPARLSGKTAIAKAFSDLFGPNPSTITITPRDLMIQEFGEVAIVTAHLRDVPTTPIPEGFILPRRTFVLHRKADRWWIVHLHASNFQVAPVSREQGGTK